MKTLKKIIKRPVLPDGEKIDSATAHARAIRSLQDAPSGAKVFMVLENPDGSYTAYSFLGAGLNTALNALLAVIRGVAAVSGLTEADITGRLHEHMSCGDLIREQPVNERNPF